MFFKIPLGYLDSICSHFKIWKVMVQNTDAVHAFQVRANPESRRNLVASPRTNPEQEA